MAPLVTHAPASAIIAHCRAWRHSRPSYPHVLPCALPLPSSQRRRGSASSTTASARPRRRLTWQSTAPRPSCWPPTRQSCSRWARLGLDERVGLIEAPWACTRPPAAQRGNTSSGGEGRPLCAPSPAHPVKLLQVTLSTPCLLRLQFIQYMVLFGTAPVQAGNEW